MFSDPVVGEKFFGRTEILALLHKRVSALQDGYRQNMAIVGPKLIGKSSLILQHFLGFNHPRIIPIYIDLKPRSFNHFAYKFIGTLLYKYLKNKHLEVGEELGVLKEYAQNTLPETVNLIHLIENNIKNCQVDQAYKNILASTAVFNRESKISCILIFDEFHYLQTYKSKNPFADLAKEIMMQKDTMYILISSQVNYAKKIIANEISLLFGNFEVIHIKPFDYNTCCKFLEKRFQDIILPKTLKDFLISFSRGHPFYLDILSDKLKEKAKQSNQKEITPFLISQTLNSLVYDSKGILNQYFSSRLSHNLNGADYSNYLPILLSTSKKGCRLNEISKLANRHPRIVSKQIDYLIGQDLLGKVGVFYRMQDEMFRFWLKSVYQRKYRSLIADPVIESNEFSKEIEKQIVSFFQESEKRLTERVIELFKCFRNEIIKIQNKSFKFLHFEEVRPWALGNLQDCIIARYKDGVWACMVKNARVGDWEIHQFYRYCRTSKYKIRKAIVISLEGLDLNVRLIALEKKICIWSTADLNLLFDLFGKQRVIS